MASTIAGYQLISRNLVRSLEQVARKPDVSRETSWYLAHIGEVKSADEFVKDDRLFSYAKKAYGLASMTCANELLRKVLAEGISGSAALANKFVDARYREFAAAFDFASLGEYATQTASATSGTVARYLHQALEEDAGQHDEGVRLALYFERKAPGIKNAGDILADKALLKVVQTALGISTLTAMAEADQQAAMLTGRIDFAEFQVPEKLRRFLQRFSVMWESDDGQALSSPAVIAGQPIEAGITATTLAILQDLKLGS